MGGGVTKIAQGNISEGFGDITQAATKTGLDMVTGGNKSLVDGFTGGAITSVEGAARGNTKDLIRGGATGLAAFYGGPMGAMAVNNAFSGGGNIIDAGLAYMGTETQGGNMNLSDLLNPSNPIGNLATTYLTGLANNAAKPKPVVIQEVAAPIPVAAPISAPMDYKKLAIFGGAGVLGLILILRLTGRK